MLNKVPINHFAKVGAGQGAPQKETDFSNEGFPFIRAGHLEDLLNGKDELNLPKVNEEIAKLYRLKLYQPNTIVFAKSGMSAMKGRIYKLNNPCYVVNHLATLELNKKTSPNYTVFLLRYFSPVRLINDTSYPSLKQSTIEKYELPLPSLHDQLHIANILSKAESLIAQRKESIALLDEFLKSTFLVFFDNPVTNRAKLKVVKLKELITFLTSGGRGWGEYYSKNGERFIRSLDVQMNYISTEDAAYVMPPNNQEANRTKVKPHDILLTITGSKIGRVAMVPKDFGIAYVSQHVAIIRTKDINPLYLSYYLGDINCGQYLIQKSFYGQTKPGLNFKQIENFDIILPPISLQTQFAQIVEKTEALKTQYQCSLQELENLYGSLSQKAFKGELVV